MVGDYSITFARSARKELEALHAYLVERIMRKIEALADQPRPIGCRKLQREEVMMAEGEEIPDPFKALIGSVVVTV